MLTAQRLGRLGRGGRIGRLAPALLTATVAILLAAPALAARADSGPPPGCTAVVHADGSVTYHCHKPGGGDPGSPGTGPTGPSCTLISPATFCDTVPPYGLAPCWYAPLLPPFALPEGPKPPGGQAVLEMCYPPVDPVLQGLATRAVWLSPGQAGIPSLVEQAQDAMGQIQVPAAHLAFSPPGRSVVGVPTWFWATGAPGGDLRGTSAFGLVAIATPAHLLVHTGDGSTVTCPWVTSAAAASSSCAHTYLKSSVDGTATSGGQPAYAASVTAQWSVRFEADGVAVTIPGIPDTIESAATTSAIPVAEIQAIVSGAR